MLFHSEGRPTESAYEVVDEIDQQINTEIAAWHEFVKTDDAKRN